MLSYTQNIRVLIADDDETDRIYVASKISSWGFQTQLAIDGLDAYEKALTYKPQVVVSDVRMPRLTGVELIERLNELGTPPPVILLTQFGGTEAAVAAVHDAGAFWFLEKPVPPGPLRALISRAAKLSTLVDENHQLRDIVAYQQLGDLVGTHPRMMDIYELIRRVAPTQAPVLITGESGTGKEVVARTIHALSPRAAGRFEAVNCAALPETLVESELFGHERGAFTGASERRAGRIEAANGGTLFLDEIGELAPALQAKLLRVLEDSNVRRLGSGTDVRVDIRLLAATNREPQEAIRDKKLREDLYYRLSVFHIRLPALRERVEDIPLLSTSLLKALCEKHELPAKTVTPALMDKLKSYPWPGNVRELRNILERAVILSGKLPMGASHLPDCLSNGAESDRTTNHKTDAGARPGVTISIGQTMAEAERQIILETFEHTGRNRQLTARILGLSRKTIQTRIREYLGPAVEEQDRG